MTVFGIGDAEMEERLKELRSLVAKPVPEKDPEPGLVGDNVYVGNKYHVADVNLLERLGVTAVMNCAASGIQDLPIHDYNEKGIEYSFTNIPLDAEDYPILHNRDGIWSEHLAKAKQFYDSTRAKHGKVLFFCVAGQNRSPTLALAVQVVSGASLQHLLTLCSKNRPFVLENAGFQRQLLELEAMHRATPCCAPVCASDAGIKSDAEVVVELIAPGLGTYNVAIPKRATIESVKQVFLNLLNSKFSAQWSGLIGTSWLVFTMYGAPEANMILEEAAVEGPVQLARLSNTFGLDIGDQRSTDCSVRWNDNCRFELIIFSIVDTEERHRHFTWRHVERPGALGTLLSQSLAETHLRAWDFTTGEAYRSTKPIVFSFSKDPRNKRDFMEISSAGERERQHFDAPGKDGILGMGSNAIVHHIHLDKVEPERPSKRSRCDSGYSDSETESDKVVLRTIDVFKDLSETELSKVARALTEETYREGVQIVKQGEEGDAFYIIKWGKTKVTKMDEGVEVVIDAEMGPGSFFGEQALVTAEPRMATVTASSMVRCMKLNRKTFDEVRNSMEPALKPTMAHRKQSMQSATLLAKRSSSAADLSLSTWDAAVKRCFSLPAMLASMESRSEAGVAKRLRMAGALNKQGRLLFFYGMGIGVSCDSDNHSEFKFETALLSQYLEDFSTYTLKMFMDDYVARPDSVTSDIDRDRVEKLQSQFSLIQVKVLLVSLLNAFRDLTLAGVQAFDFNHLNNVLISRDYRQARLIDIDGNNQGSIQFDPASKYIHGKSSHDESSLHKPALDVDLSTLLPLLVQQLLCGKGRGKTFVSAHISKVKSDNNRSVDAAKATIKSVIKENFFSNLSEREAAESKHLSKVTIWFHAMLMKSAPWDTWTNDIYDAMRCIDHLPIG